MSRQEQLHIITTLVENKPGVLFRFASLIRRNFNIESISVGPTERYDIARMTITIKGDERIVEQVVRQLSKLVDVVKILRLDADRSVIREPALIKVHVADSKARSDLIHYVNIFRGRVVDISPESATIEITGTPSKIDAFVDLMKVFGIKELARTGLTALARGPRTVRE